MSRKHSDRVSYALTVAKRYGQTDGAHHKQWVIDQMVRALTGDSYRHFLVDYQLDNEGEWDEGVAP